MTTKERIPVDSGKSGKIPAGIFPFLWQSFQLLMKRPGSFR